MVNNHNLFRFQETGGTRMIVMMRPKRTRVRTEKLTVRILPKIIPVIIPHR